MQDRCFSNCTIMSGSPLSLVSTARPSTSSAASLRGCEMQQLWQRHCLCHALPVFEQQECQGTHGMVVAKPGYRKTSTLYLLKVLFHCSVMLGRPAGGDVFLDRSTQSGLRLRLHFRRPLPCS